MIYCVICFHKADGPMLRWPTDGGFAHANCVIKALNKLLDPLWEPGCGREPEEIVGFHKDFVIHKVRKRPDLVFPEEYYEEIGHPIE